MKKLMKWIGIIIGLLIMVVILIAAGLALYANMSFKRKIANRPLYPIQADLSPEGAARGKYLMEQAMLCTEACHTPENGPALSGGFEEIQDGPISARLAFPNLTSDPETGLGSWSDSEIARAIREGVDKDGVELVMMPSFNYNALSDSDVSAIIGYLRTLAPTKNVIPPFNANLLGKTMIVMGAFGPRTPQDPITNPKIGPQPGTVEYGEYMVRLGACTDCHQKNLAGGPLPFSEPGSVPSANLTPGGELVGWTEADFIRGVREGIKPGGDHLSEDMPRYQTSDEDLKAIFAYLKTLPALPANQ
jgi:mono/diheme cytochrome c family protein